MLVAPSAAIANPSLTPPPNPSAASGPKPAARPAATGPTGTIATFDASETVASDPEGITTGPDGNVWFTDAGASTVGRIAVDGTGLTEAPTDTPGASPVGIASDGATRLWFTEQATSVGALGSITPALNGQHSYPTANAPGSRPSAIVQGSDDKLWFTELGDGSNASIGTITSTAAAGTSATDYPVTSTSSTPTGIASDPAISPDLFFTEAGTTVTKIGEMTPSGTMVHEFAVEGGTGSGRIDGIAGGSDGNLWYTEPALGAIGKMTPSGVTSTVATGSVVTPTAITAGPDGNLWFVDAGANAIGRITTAGTVTEFAVPTPNAFSPAAPPTGITAGPDGNIWFTEQGAAAAIGRVTIAPAADVSPTSLAFASQPIGTASGSQLVTIASPGAGSLSISSVSLSGPDAADFSLVDLCTGAVLVPATPHCQVGVTFVPTSGPTGSRTATLSFADDAGSGSQTVTLSGIATAGAGFNVNELNFGNQPVGTKSAPITLTFTNGTSTPVKITSAAVGGVDAGQFSIADHCSGTSLAPGQTCTIPVTFAPSVAGSRSATLSMTDSAAGSPHTVSLQGTGAAVGISFTPASLDFGREALGATSTDRAVTITNITARTIEVDRVEIVGPAPADYTVTSDQCATKTLVAGATCSVKIAFNPTLEGVRSATLSVSDTAPGSPQGLVLAGRGVHVSGYWLEASDGGIFSFGNGAPFFGSTGGMHLNKPIVGMAATPDSQGYWEVASDGGIFSFGDATFFGSTGGMHLNKPIVGMASTPDGQGYWLVASDGGIFSFGDATFFGSTGGMHLNKPIVSMAPTPDGQGYWLTASDGGIFSYGDAGFFGSSGSIKLNKPILGMAPTPDGQGYWLTASDGGIFSYGDAGFFGSSGSIKLNKPIVDMAATPSGGGYWLVASDGGIFTYGDAPFLGSTGSLRLNKPVVGMAPVL